MSKRGLAGSIASTVVDEVLSGLEGPFVLGNFGFGHVHHPEDLPDARFQSPACVVWPENRAVALVLLALEKKPHHAWSLVGIVDDARTAATSDGFGFPREDLALFTVQSQDLETWPLTPWASEGRHRRLVARVTIG
jgi:hypothetical protein